MVSLAAFCGDFYAVKIPITENNRVPGTLVGYAVTQVDTCFPGRIMGSIN